MYAGPRLILVLVPSMPVKSLDSLFSIVYLIVFFIVYFIVYLIVYYLEAVSSVRGI